MKIRSLLIVSHLILLTYCSKKANTNCVSNLNSVDSSIETRLEAVRIVVPDSLRSEYYLYDLLETESGFIYGGWDEKGMTINLYDSYLNKWQRVNIDEKYIKGKLASITVVSKDSIFLLRQELPLLYLFNNNGDPVQQWDLSKPYKNELDASIYLLRGNSSKVRFNSDKSIIVMPFMMFEASYYPKNTTFGVVNVYDLNESKWLGKPFGRIPDIYLKSEYPLDLSFPDITFVRKNQLAISFPLSPLIELYDITNQKKVNEFCTRSDRFPINRTLPKNSSLQDQENYLNTAPFYSGLYYLGSTNQFIRTYFKEQPLKGPNGRLNQLKLRKVYVGRIDLELNTKSFSTIESNNPVRLMSKFSVASDGNNLYSSINLNKSDDYLSLSKIQTNE